MLLSTNLERRSVPSKYIASKCAEVYIVFRRKALDIFGKCLLFTAHIIASARTATSSVTTISLDERIRTSFSSV